MVLLSSIDNLISVKKNLADKYARLANLRQSKPLKMKLSRQSERYNREVERLSKKFSR